MEQIAKIWGQCPRNKGEVHWAFYIFQDEEDRKYWKDEHYDERGKFYYRHNDFMSIPCTACGTYSPLRAATQFCSSGNEGCKREEIINYRPGIELPDNLATYYENGWFYIFFKETLSDSLCGQETFRLRQLPDGCCHLSPTNGPTP